MKRFKSRKKDFDGRMSIKKIIISILLYALAIDLLVIIQYQGFPPMSPERY